MKLDSIISFYNSESAEATEFRRLYSNLTRDGNNKLKSVVLTSSTLEEGKSLIASYLAITVAESTENRVLLLDADLRRPIINMLFKLPFEEGFADLLEKRCKINQTIKSTPIPGLNIITAGKPKASPTLAVNQSCVSEIVEELKFYFDFIIIDAPPVITVSDPLIIANEVDGTLLVVRAGATPKEVVKRTTNLLLNSKVNLLGVVLNDFDEVLPYYYNTHYYGYKYYNTKGRKNE